MRLACKVEDTFVIGYEGDTREMCIFCKNAICYPRKFKLPKRG